MGSSEKWWLVKPKDPKPGTRTITPMWIGETALAVKEREWRKDPSLGGWEKQEITGVAMDCGGAISADAKMLETPFFGATLYIHAIHVEIFIEHLRSLEARPSGFFNIGSWPALLMLTREQKDAALAWLFTIREEALGIAAVENADFNAKFVDNPQTHFRAVARPVVKKFEEA